MYQKLCPHTPFHSASSSHLCYGFHNVPSDNFKLLLIWDALDKLKRWWSRQAKLPAYEREYENLLMQRYSCLPIHSDKAANMKICSLFFTWSADLCAAKINDHFHLTPLSGWALFHTAKITAGWLKKNQNAAANLHCPNWYFSVKLHAKYWQQIFVSSYPVPLRRGLKNWGIIKCDDRVNFHTYSPASMSKMARSTWVPVDLSHLTPEALLWPQVSNLSVFIKTCLLHFCCFGMLTQVLVGNVLWLYAGSLLWWFCARYKKTLSSFIYFYRTSPVMHSSFCCNILYCLSFLAFCATIKIV